MAVCLTFMGLGSDLHPASNRDCILIFLTKCVIASWLESKE